jgi:hypothetical protein
LGTTTHVTEHLYGAPVAAIDMSLTATERSRVRVSTVDDPLLPVGRLAIPTSVGDVVVTMRPAEFDAFARAVAEARDWMRTEMSSYIADADVPVTRRVVA